MKKEEEEKNELTREKIEKWKIYRKNKEKKKRKRAKKLGIKRK